MRVLPLVLKRIFLYVGNKKHYLMLLKTMNFLAKSGTILEEKKSKKWVLDLDDRGIGSS